MRSSKLVRSFLCALLALGGCKTSEPGAGAVTSTPPEPSATAPAALSASAARPAAPPAPGDAGRLPRGAAIYVAARLDALDAWAGTVPALKAERDRLAKRLGGKDLASSLAALGVAGDRPVLVAFVPPDEGALRSAMDEALKSPTKATSAQHALGLLTRILAPLSPGAGAARIVDKLAAMEREPEIERCPGAPSCATVGGEGLVALIRTTGGVTSVRQRNDTAEIDQFTPLLGYGTDATALLGMSRLAGLPLGGPEAPRCSRFDPTKAASMCVDADRTAVFGMATEYGISMGAVLMTSADIDREQRIRVLGGGKADGDRNTELASPARRLLDDGTMTFTREGPALRAVASWALTPASRAAVEKELASPVCAPGQAFVRDVLPRLSRAFGDPGPDFAQPKERMAHVKEAGWAAYPILMSRTWPNLLPGLMKDYEPQATQLVGAGKVCAAARDGRLEIESNAR